MTSIIGKTFRLNNGGPGSDMKQPDEQEFIRNLNYAELEEKFQIYKYYPCFIHNNECSTPRLKAMISDKPIYAKASGISKNEEKAKKQVARRAERDKLHRQKIDHLQERRDLRHEQKLESREHKLERHQLKQQQREVKKPGCRLIDRATKGKIFSEIEHVENVENTSQGLGLGNKPITSLEATARGEHAPTFTNPFGSGQTTLVASNDIKVENVDPRSDRNLIRRASISDRLRGLFIKRPATSESDKRSMSFDQTKTNMTTSRAAEHALMKLTENRRPSDEIRTYFFKLCEIILFPWIRSISTKRERLLP